MYKLYFVRKDNPKVRKFDGTYNNIERLNDRILEVRIKKYVSESWGYGTYQE